MTDHHKRIAVIIPALDPDEKMTGLVRDLHMKGFVHIILVDDGSEIKNRVYFKKCKEEYGAKIIRHVVNFGKGIAIKSALNHLIDNEYDIKGVVTCDCDGQHLAEDIDKCARITYEHQDRLVLGCRGFDEADIPPRSRFGNKCTKVILRLITGLKVSDTQTGLRGIPMSLVREHFVMTKGERYEYEMNMLLEAREYHIPIEEFPIRTVYLDSNKSSHFNPFRDSIRIYKVFIKFMLSSFSSFLIDIIMFYLLGILLRPLISENAYIYGVSVFILTRTVLARATSSVYNFIMNKTKVFKNRSGSPGVIFKYYFLVVIQLTLSAVLVNYTFTFIPYLTLRKIIIDTILFCISFVVQREWVFKEKPSGNVRWED
ncbi:MAG: bifunctional glycosyltransferase family 2/GtrA family protein [Eubacterium sp.]|nr:bifunctional glycosyltransferase family 2/GtrA family protein [Eubacterium sp.]